MADNYREETATRKRGRSASKLSVRLFLLDPNKDITKVTKEIGSEKGLNELKQKGYGPPSKEYCVASDKVEFSLELTNEQFKQKLVEIYPSLESACFVFMKAGKDNTLKELNPGVCCYRCYTPENVYSSERGQGKLYIRIIPENEISPCSHGLSLLKRLRCAVGGSQLRYVPIAPKPVAAVVPAPSTTLPSTTTVISVATPTNYQLSALRNHETESRTALSNLPALDLSSSLINVAQAESIPVSQNSGNMVTQTPLLSRAAGTILPSPGVNLLEKSTVQGSSSISEAATRSEARSSDNTVAQSPIAVSSITSQSAVTPPIHHSVGTSSLTLPSQQINSSVNMILSQQLPLSATVSQMASMTPVSGSFDKLSQRQLVTLASNSLPSQPFDSSVAMAPQGQLGTLTTLSQTSSTAPVNGRFPQGQLPAPSQPFGSSVNMVPQGQSLASSTVSQIAPTPPGNGSFNILPRGQLAFSSSANVVPQRQLSASSIVSQIQPTTPVNGSFNMLPPEQLTVNNSVSMVPQGQLATSATGSQLVSRQVQQPFAPGNTTPESEIPGSAEASDESFGQSFFNVFSQLVALSSYTSFNADQELEAAETDSQMTNEAIRELHPSNIAPSAVTSHASSRITQSLGLNLLADVVGVAQREQWKNSIAGAAHIQEHLQPKQKESRIAEFFQNVESTGKLEISLDVLSNDVLLKKLNESSNSIRIVEIQSTCEVHQVLKKFSLPTSLRVLRIRENSLSFEDITDLLRCLRSVDNLRELDLCHTNFNESTFFIFISALHYCKDLTVLILTDNSLTEQEINGLITVFESVKDLKILNLSKSILTETQANAILHKHELAKNIVTLNLSHNSIQGNEISVGICQLQSLKELDLSYNCIRFSPLPNLEGKRDHLSICLKVISLSSNHMKPDDISQFCSLIRSDLLELNLDFNHVGHSIWSLCSLGGKIKHLKVLSLANADICDNVDGLAFLLSLVRELEDLNLSFNNLMAEDFQQLQTSLSKLTQLKTLNLSMNVIGRDGMKALKDIFKKFPLLERLDMNSSYIREDEVSVLCKSFVSLKKLKYLNLSGNNIDIVVLDGALALPTTLEELLFSDIIHGQKLFAEMRQLINLKKLHLNKLTLRSCDAEALAIMLRCVLKLEELSLACLVAPGCEAILTAMKSLKNVRKIDLTGMKFSNGRALVDMLLSRKFLQELVLNEINGEGIENEKLFSAIKLSKHLRKLSLDDVGVFDGAKALSDMFSSLSILKGIVFPDLSLIDAVSITGCFKDLKSLGNLRSLDLRSTKIWESTIRALAEVLPSLQLLEMLGLTLDLRNDESEGELFAAFGKLKNLKELLFSETRLNSINCLAMVLPSLQLLEKVDLGIFVFNERHKLLLDALGKLRYLKEFSYGMIFENADIEAFAHALSSLPLLKKLSFVTLDLSNTENVGQLYSAIGKLAYLRRLDLTISGTTFNNLLEALAKVLPSLELLEELKLHWDTWNRLESDYVKQVFAAISKLRYLKKLDYTCPFRDYTDVEAFGEMLTSLRLLEKLALSRFECKNKSEKRELFITAGKLTYLKTLDLGDDLKITRTNVKALVRALPSLRMLENLKLDYIYDINESRGEELLTAVAKLKHLKKLYLDWRKMTQTNVDTLVRTLASLQVLEELTLKVNFYCNHDCDDDCDHDCDDECDHDCFFKCRHVCDAKCDEECGHNCYHGSCNKCRHDEAEKHMDFVKTKVLHALKDLKYFKKCELFGHGSCYGTVLSPPCVT